jgi:hypothetical protein
MERSCRNSSGRAIYKTEVNRSRTQNKVLRDIEDFISCVVDTVMFRVYKPVRLIIIYSYDL